MIILFFLNLYFNFLHASLLVVDKPYQIYETNDFDNLFINQASVKLILKDPDNLINKAFKVPANLNSRVFFWAMVYGFYTSKEIVVHDREDLSIVYNVLDFTLIWDDTSLNRYQKFIKMRKEIDIELNRIKTILEALKNKKAKSQEELEIYKLHKDKINIKNKSQILNDAIKNLRTQTGQKDFFKQGISSSGSYMEQIEKIFYEQKLPVELARLSFVESSFNINAVSKVGAKGLWQIMDETGMYYLELSKHIDERISPIKASRVAASILKQDYRILKTWPLAVTAYNFGAARLKRAVSTHKNSDLAYLINNYKNPYFGFAVKNFYASFLAALHVYTYQDFLFGKIEKHKAKNLEGLIIEKDININALANILSLSIEEISEYNPDLKKPVLSGAVDIKKGYEIKLPKDLTIKLIAYFIRFLDGKDLKDTRN